MATPLPRPLSHPDGCLILERLLLPVVSADIGKLHFPCNQPLFELVNTARLADLIVSLLSGALRQCALASLG